MNSVKERLKHFLKNVATFDGKLGIGEGKFEARAKLPNGTVSNIGENPTNNTLQKIKSVLPTLNIDWLLTGQGDMLLINVRNNNDKPNTILDNQSSTDGFKYAHKVVEVMDSNMYAQKMVQSNFEKSLDNERKALENCRISNENLQHSMDHSKNLAEENRQLIEVLRAIHKPTADAARQNHLGHLSPDLVDKMAEEGIALGLWKTMDQGQLILGKLAAGGVKTKQE